MTIIERITSGGSRAFNSIQVVLGNLRLILFPLFLFVPIAGFFAILMHAGYINVFNVQSIYNLHRFFGTLSLLGKLQFSLFIGVLCLPLLIIFNIALAQCAGCVLLKEGVHIAQSLRFGFSRLYASLPTMLALITFFYFLIFFPEGIIHSLLHLTGGILFYFAFPVLADESVPSLGVLYTSVKTFAKNIVEVATGSVILVTFASLGSFVLLHFGGALGMGTALIFGEKSVVTLVATLVLPLLWLLAITAAGMVFAVDLYRHTK